jgi:hypothetical protein
MKINEITEGVFSNLAKHYGGQENYNATSKWAAPLAAKGKDWVKSKLAGTSATGTPPPSEPIEPTEPTSTAGAGAFGQMATQMQTQPHTTATGGTTQQTPGVTKNTASATNPNLPAAPVKAPAAKAGKAKALSPDEERMLQLSLRQQAAKSSQPTVAPQAPILPSQKVASTQQAQALTPDQIRKAKQVAAAQAAQAQMTPKK